VSAGSEGKPEWEFRREAYEREQFKTDPAMWLERHFDSLKERMSWHSDEREEQAKNIAQNIAESIAMHLEHKRDSLVVWMGILAMIALASAQLWIGGGLVGLIVIWVWWRSRTGWKQVWRLGRFRQRFRELSRAWSTAQMLAEDKEFVRKYKDSILYPLAVPEHDRELPRVEDLEHIETLYREYCYSPDHHHLAGIELTDPDLAWDKNHLRDCELCSAARRVQEHIEAAISAFEGEITKWREALVSRVDGRNPEGAILTKEVLEDFRKWKAPSEAGTEIRALIEWLQDKECWTFDQADKVMDAFRADKSVRTFYRILLSDEMRATVDRGADPHYEGGELAWKVYVRLLEKMTATIAQNELSDGWRHYLTLRHELMGLEESGTFRSIRQVIQRKKPETMFRELSERTWVFSTDMDRLRGYGYDSKLVKGEVVAAQRFLAKEGGKWDKCYAKELAAAKAFAFMEKASEDLRYEERSTL
jgi:hypothetical protein